MCRIFIYLFILYTLYKISEQDVLLTLWKKKNGQEKMCDAVVGGIQMLPKWCDVTWHGANVSIVNWMQVNADQNEPTEYQTAASVAWFEAACRNTGEGAGFCLVIYEYSYLHV